MTFVQKATTHSSRYNIMRFFAVYDLIHLVLGLWMPKMSAKVLGPLI